MPDPSHPSPSRTILLGLAVFVFGVLVTLSPFLLGRGSLNRFIVVFGLVGVFIGGSCVIHGGWDWLRGRGR
jgi:hypothetical protein